MKDVVRFPPTPEISVGERRLQRAMLICGVVVVALLIGPTIWGVVHG